MSAANQNPWGNIVWSDDMFNAVFGDFARDPRANEHAHPKKKEAPQFEEIPASTFCRALDDDGAEACRVVYNDGSRSKPLRAKLAWDILKQHGHKEEVVCIEPLRRLVRGGICQINGVAA